MGDYAKPDTSMSSTVFEGMKQMMEKMQSMSSPAAGVVKKLESGGDVMNMMGRKAASVVEAGMQAGMKTAKAMGSSGGMGGGGGMFRFGKQGAKEDKINY